MTDLLSSVTELSSIGDRLFTLLQIIAIGGFAYLAYRSIKIRSID